MKWTTHADGHEHALREGSKTSTEIAAKIGKSDGAVRMTTAWKRRQEVSAC
jgi:hypothetical protein